MAGDGCIKKACGAIVQGLGREILNLKTRVRFPVALPINFCLSPLNQRAFSLPKNLREFSSAAGTPRRAGEAVRVRRAERRLFAGCSCPDAPGAQPDGRAPNVFVGFAGFAGLAVGVLFLPGLFFLDGRLRRRQPGRQQPEG